MRSSPRLLLALAVAFGFGASTMQPAHAEPFAFIHRWFHHQHPPTTPSPSAPPAHRADDTALQQERARTALLERELAARNRELERYRRRSSPAHGRAASHARAVSVDPPPPVTGRHPAPVRKRNIERHAVATTGWGVF